MSYIKLNSLEDGPYTSVYNNVDLEIPAGDYDFSKSYVQLLCTMPSTLTASQINLTYLTGVVAKTGTATSLSNLYSISLVKNCSISTDSVGMLENVRRNNILKQNLKDVMLSQADKLSQVNSTYNMIGNYRDGHNILCRQVERYGTTNSRLIQSPIRIDLKDLFALGGLTAYPSKLGNTRIHLELQPDVMVAKQLNANGAVLEGLEVQPITTGDTSINVAYPQERPNPFYNGLRILVPIDGAAATEAHVITGIEYDTTIDSYVLTLDSAVTTDLTAATDFSATAYTSVGTNLAFSINKVEIVLKKYINPLPAMPSLTYRTFTTEEVNGFPIGNYSKMFYLEPECVNLFILFPGIAENQLVSVEDPALSYRLRVDNEDLTNRDVVVNTPLYFDRINMTFNNAGKDFKLKNLRMTNNAVSSRPVDSITNKLMMICTPVPPTQKEKLLQVNITASVAVPRMILFKQCLRSVNM